MQIELRDLTRNVDIRKRKHIKDVSYSAPEIKWRWAGYIVRLDHNRWTHKATIWDPYQEDQADQQIDGRTTRNKPETYGPEQRGTAMIGRITMSVKSGRPSTSSGMKSKIRRRKKLK